MPDDPKPTDIQSAPELPGEKPVDLPINESGLSAEANKLPEPEIAEPQSGATDQAVEDIVKHESDELLEVEDAKHSSSKRQPWYRIFKKKKVWIPAVIIVILVLLLSLPISRYRVFGLFWKQNYKLVVMDTQTNKPITDVLITLDGKTATTNNQGQASIHVPTGHATLTISKKYYKTFSQKILVPLHVKNVTSFKLQATGRQVPLTLINKISGLPISNVLIAAAGTESRTDKNGQTTIVLPADKSTITASASASGYNNATVTIQVTTNSVPANTFSLTPSGTMYFLSNASGTIDVVSTNLDGSNRQTVLAGTGKENPTNTQLFNSTDWKYLALVATRNVNSTDNGTLYLVDPSSGTLTTIQSGVNNNVSVVGWSSTDQLIYAVSSTTLGSWQSGGEVLKSYNPSTAKSITLDQTIAAGTSSSDYAAQSIENEFILGNNTVLYTKRWTASYPTTSVSAADKQMEVDVVSTTGTNKQTIKTFPTDFNSYLSVIENKPGDYYISANATSTTFYEYVSGAIKTAPNTVTAQTFNNSFTSLQSTFYLSSDATKAVWSTPRDGHTAVFSGDSSGNNSQQIATLDSTFSVAGWYSSDYVLLQKSSSELYIMPASGLIGTAQPLKITDYYSPTAR